ncbi:arginyl-tRNA synthetase [Basidiobolus meristosporus CBS 931.73]|uniref:arginine--tRNA ligase n=1 Tax=Basidiobolus meristosporus CBS 931.73 TaxID=1314790 RepID=A0A1Y1YU74_9FUNG|nr:arginyl-tRNA synthetase [Basidiobolus meristosporus CBS 931.73]|eukprot:ORY01529.1 arginyl-tRNA synthetase [Basidiobolus meristosporus CBS 931.73]
MYRALRSGVHATYKVPVQFKRTLTTLDEFKLRISRKVSDLSGLESENIRPLLEIPKLSDHGDFALALPKLKLPENPVKLAQRFSQQFPRDDWIVNASPQGPFLNFNISKTKLRDLTLKEVLTERDRFGENTSGENKLALVEFSSPNIAKPFHAGHLRSTILGNFVRNVHKANGWKTLAMNYLGDWGKQYGLLAVGYEKYGSEAELDHDPIKHLYHVYVKINADANEDDSIHEQARGYFKRMEDGDEEALSLWKRFRELSIAKYQETYSRLNVPFDVYSGESQVNAGLAMARELLEKKGLLVDSNNAKILDFSDEKLGKVVVEKSDGTSLYLTRDIGAAMERHSQYQFDAMYYVVGSQQDLHIKQLFKTLEKLDFPWAKTLKHVNFGMITGMSTRKGTVVFLEDILNQTQELMHMHMKKNQLKYSKMANPEEVADIVGMSAIIVQDMSARRLRNYDFNWNRMFSFEGDTGPYLQYAHARLCSIERNSSHDPPHDLNADVNFSALNEPPAIELIEIISQYPQLVRGLMNSLEPCNVVTYALRLSHAVSHALESLWVKGAEKETAEARLALYQAARITLGNSLRLIGLKPLERM